VEKWLTREPHTGYSPFGWVKSAFGWVEMYDWSGTNLMTKKHILCICDLLMSGQALGCVSSGRSVY